MRRHVAFYVHHQGRGHTTRARALIDALELPATVLTSVDDADPATFGDAQVVRLPPDDGDGHDPVGVPLPRQLHYAPVGVPGLRERMATITRVLADLDPAVLVVDVSSEVAQLARLMGVPTVVVRQHGARWDRAHRAAYEGAVGLLAPFGRELEEPDVPTAVRRRTVHVGGLGRFTAPPLETPGQVRPGRGASEDGRMVVLLRGRGGHGPSDAQVFAAAKATPGHRWIVVGDAGQTLPGIEVAGWMDDPLPYLAAADVVVGAAGHNTVMEVASVARPFVCVPQPRPFDEQVRKAARLHALDVAEVCDDWPRARAWPGVLERARRRGGDGLASLVDPYAARRAADWLTELVDRLTG